MSENERIYPRKPRKPVVSERSKELKKQRRAHKRIAKTRVKDAVSKWKEMRELQKILLNRAQPSIDQFFPSLDERVKKEKEDCDPENGV